jgi:hypothetical protein
MLHRGLPLLPHLSQNILTTPYSDLTSAATGRPDGPVWRGRTTDGERRERQIMDQKASTQPTQPAPSAQAAPVGAPRGADPASRDEAARDTDRPRPTFRDWASI